MEASSYTPTATEPQSDSIETSLRGIAQNMFMVIFGLLPIFFIPVAYAPFMYSKVIAVIMVVLIGIIFFSLSVLRSGYLRLAMPWALTAFWGVTIANVIAAALSSNPSSSFVGNVMGVQTACFMVVMAVVMTLPILMRQSKTTIMRMYILLTVSAIILALFHFARLVFGVHFLSLGLFTSATSTPLGSWNDLGLFAGVSILLALVALEQLPLTRPGKWLFSVVVAFSLVLLAVVNFFAVWLVLGLVSLILLMYSLTKERFTEKAEGIPTEERTSAYSISIVAIVFIASLIFIIGGSTVSNIVSHALGINYVEVRPSLQSTLDIGRQIYSHNLLTGIGPNKFVNAWRLYKNSNINQTIFWSTDFAAGSGYLTTQFVTTGLLGIVTWLAFLILFVWTGLRMLFRTTAQDRFWYFIGTSSFVAAVYFWGMGFIYNPGAVIMLLTAVFTGITFVAYGMLVGSRSATISVSTNRRAALMLVGAVMVVIIVSASVLFYAGRHYASVYAFNHAVAGVKSDKDIPTAEQQIATAYNLNQNAAYARQLAAYEIYTMNTLRAVQKPTSDQQQQFQSAATKAVNAGRLAVQTDGADPANWTTLGTVYSILAAVGVDATNTKELATKAFATAKKFDPQNPTYDLLTAQLDAQTNDLAGARTAVNTAIQTKPDYTDALYLLSQLDIADGKVDDAIKTTQSIISLDPQNPARYYQLGVLESSAKQYDTAIAAFQKAISLDQNYANAHYMLALTYLQKNDPANALTELDTVLKLNPGNSQITKLIDQIKNGGTTAASSTTATAGSISDPSGVSQQNGAVTTTKAPHTPLVSSVNTVPSGDQSSSTNNTVGQ